MMPLGWVVVMEMLTLLLLVGGFFCILRAIIHWAEISIHQAHEEYIELCLESGLNLSYLEYERTDLLLRTGRNAIMGCDQMELWALDKVITRLSKETSHE